ncbi:hypothetical protein HX001_01865 [Empedobacter brevis]|uniref:RHS repeat protein n=1 Tax=Empedobacter brevis TaxID=247 RepID=A0AAJ1QC33_9FLAO|nr:hypothetical protein [Empedobacter brevis]MDM1071236.1 hypothetical protein [Empedobacter brevis]QHC85404.1 hypothetical protein AS589_11740 [Empedobacter brevis]
MKKRYIPLLYLFLSVNAFAQNNSSAVSTPDVFPKTPEAASLGKFIDIPSGNYTGVATFTIPLYEIEFDGEKILIQLTYTTTGVKVGEIASRVGLGWALDYGASLSQQVIGYPDFYGHSQRRIINPSTFNPNTGSSIDKQYASEATNVTHGVPIDLQPDLFSYSIIGDNGHFIVDADGNRGIPMPYNQTNITDKGRKIVNDKGFIHEFSSAILSATSYNTCNTSVSFEYNDPNYKINKISNPSKTKEISFVYSLTSNTKYFVSKVEQKLIQQIRHSGYGGNPIPPPIPENCYNYTVGKDPILTEIKFPNGKIIFSYVQSIEGEAKRKDLPGDYILKNVKVMNNNNSVIRDYTFNYYYKQSSSFPTGIQPFYLSFMDGVDYRLYLESVKENLSNSEYKLEYYTGNNNQTLPHRMSNDQDYWGVYNGTNNSTSIPTFKFQNLNGGIQEYTGANKNPNLNFGIIGNLKKIVYPTKGYTKITYQNDDYLNDNDIIDLNSNAETNYTGNLRISQIESKDSKGGRIVRKFSYLNPITGKSSGKNFGNQNFEALVIDEIPMGSNDIGNPWVENLLLMNNPGWQTSTVRGKAVGYEYVQEIYEGNGVSFKKQYKFDNEPYNDYVYDPYRKIQLNWPMMGFQRGQLKEVIDFNSTGDWVKKEEINYDYDVYFNHKATGAPGLGAIGVGTVIKRGGSQQPYMYDFFFIENYWIKKLNKKTTEKLNGQEIVKEETYEYNSSPKHTYPWKVNTFNSRNEKIVQETTYPLDHPTETNMSDLIDMNIHSAPISKKTTNITKNIKVEETKSTYGKFTTKNFVLPQFVYVNKGNNPINTTNTTTDKEISFDAYDTYGNLTQYTVKDVTTSVIWGYKGTYPVAKIEGAKISDFSATDIKAIEDAADNATLTTKLKNLINNTSSAMVTGYVYEPLKGVTQMINPNGTSVYYNYDAYGRLLNVMKEDINGVKTTVKSNEYNYKN